jgi:succinylarginine dihydrolase
VREYNFDGLVGPTHNYGGLSLGNVASTTHGGEVSSPRRAALQGLEKMRFVHGLGVGQAVLPPQPRPSLTTLRRLGFGSGKRDEEVIADAAHAGEHLLRLCASASAMWTANAATVAPSADTADRRMHATAANLQAMFHRAIEADTTTAVLRAIFADERRFAIHAPLPGGGQLADEGAANHTRLFTTQGAVHLFAWGRRAWTTAGETAPGPVRYPARQTLDASQAVARLHRLRPDSIVFAQQHPAGIDAGAFHTDVLAVGNGPLLLMHELAFLDPEAVVGALAAALGDELRVIVAREAELPVADAVGAYPFNSQLVTRPDGRMVLVAPEESRARASARGFLERIVAAGAVAEIHFLDVRESMNNGGGPACLRQRIALTDDEVAAVGANVFFTEALDAELGAWIERRYRDRLVAADLADPALAREGLEALDELTRILRLGSVYDFQRVGT